MKKITLLLGGLLSILTSFGQNTCATATVVTPGSYVSGVLTGTGASQIDAVAARWYSFTPVSSGLLSINSCGGGADTRLWITTGTCGAQTAIANNDDAPSCISTGANSYGSRIENIVLTSGTTYYFEWDNVYTSNSFNWSFAFTALPTNNNAALVSFINEYTSVVSTFSSPVLLGGRISNLSGNPLTNVILTADVFVSSNLITPIATFSSVPSSLAVGASINATCGSWIHPATIETYLIKYTKTQTELDAVASNDVLELPFQVNYNYFARDNGVLGGTIGVAAGDLRQGNIFTVPVATTITGVQAYIATTGVGQTYTAEIYSVTAGVIGATALYTSSAQTTTGVAGFVNVNFPALAVTPGDYLAVIHHTSVPTSTPPSVAIGIGISNSIITPAKSKIKQQTGIWTNLESVTAPAVYLIRAKFGVDPAFDLRFVSNSAPQGEYTALHEREAVSGNTLVFTASARNFGTSPSANARLVLTVYNALNAVVYTATSASQTLAPNATGTFTVPSTIVTVQNRYRIEYNFISDDIDNILGNNKSETFFNRSLNYMARTNGFTSALGIGPNTVLGTYDNAVLGQTFTLTNADRIDSVRFQLVVPPVGVPVRVDVYNTLAGVPTGAPIASTSVYTTTLADSLNGVLLKLPLTTPLATGAGTYFFGVIEQAGNISLGTATSIVTAGKSYIKWDDNAAGAWTLSSAFGANFDVAFVVEPIFKTCLNITATPTITNASCTAADGGATVAVSGGTSPLSYSWNNGQNTSSLTAVNNGVFTLTITDANTCTKAVSVTIQNVSTLLATATVVNAACSSATNGSVTVVPTLGTTPYTYTWAGSAVTTATRSNLAPGSYTCTVGDFSGCEFVVIQTVTAGTSDLTATATSVNTACPTATNGSLTIAPTLGSAPYTFIWTASAVTTPARTNLLAGAYTCTVTDALGCTFAITQNVNAGTSNLAATTTATNVLCFGAPTGSISTIASLGSAPYTYSWTGTPSTSPTVNAISAGAYTCTVTDVLGCVIASNSVTVTQPSSALSLTGVVNNVTSTVNTTPSGGTAPYTYVWSNGVITQDLTDSLANGSYVLTVTDANGCNTNATYVVSSSAELEDIKGLQNLNIFPNPSNGNFSVLVQLTSISDVKIELLNNLGQVLAVKSAKTANQTFEFINEKLALGTYTIRTSVNGESTSRLITIQ